MSDSRWRGAFSRQRRSSRRTAAGASGGSASSGGVSFSTAARTSEISSPEKARRPVSISHSTHPKALAAELYLTRDRLRALERTLEGSGALTPGVLDAYKPAPEEAAALTADRDAFVASLLEHVVVARKPRQLGDLD